MDVIAILLLVAVFASLAGLIELFGPRMKGSDLFGLIVCVLVLGYLLYALLRGEKF